MTEETKPLDHAALIILCETLRAELECDESDHGMTTCDLLRSAISTFESCLARGTAQAKLPALKDAAAAAKVEDEETFQALDTALNAARAEGLHGEEKKARLKPARQARDKARLALHKANQAVTEGERQIVAAMMEANLNSQTLMSTCLQWALFVFGTTKDEFPASVEALKALNRSGTTANMLQYAARRISDGPSVELSIGNVTHLQPRTRTPDEVRVNAMQTFLSVFLPEIAQCEMFSVICQGEGAPLLALFSEPLVQAFQWHAQNELRDRNKRAAAG
jgi:hypothetical protein